MSRYPPLPSGSQHDLESAVLETWRGERLFQRTLEATRNGPPFVFYEGPPTANGRPGIHHVFARTIKDLICRYQTMLGRSVTRIAGWDTHGLPVEIEVEKELGIKGKPDIERLGVAEFNRRCKESVFRYKADWEALSERIGYWLDYDHPYVTYTNEYIESVWSLLARLHQKGLLYEGHKILPYCWRCGTALSSHELAMGYDVHKSPSIHVLFRVVERAGRAEEEGAGRAERYLLVWTTTPWTLPSNVAVAVHPDFTYVELDVEGRRVIVEKTLARKAIPGATHGKPLSDFPQVAEYQGKELIGWRYQQLLVAVEVDPHQGFRVVAGDFVTNEEGTGLVHLAPAYGADDYAAVQREGLPFFIVVDSAGRFAGTRWDAINGKNIFDANPIIAERLEREHKLFGRYLPEGYEHSYPFCWRCDSPLIYYARKSWFVRTTAFRDRMLAINRSVAWHPAEVGSGRFGEWLESNVDWALSRDRYWGTPLPVWRCSANEEHLVVLGSYRELAERMGKKSLPADFDPHKPFIDDVVFPCPECGGQEGQQGPKGTKGRKGRKTQRGGMMRRVPEVIDAWFDSGSMPYAQWHYPFEHRKEFEGHFPAEFICEGLDQTRGWFYSLLAIAAGVFDQPAYRHVIVNGLVLDAQGRKMSKRLGNVVDPLKVVEALGADTVRLYLLASSQVSLPKRFDPATIPELAGGFLNRLRNSYGFFALYAEDWTPDAPPPESARPLVDRWLLGRLDGLVAAVRAAWSGYDVTAGARAIMEFCDNDLSNWYVRVNRARFWAPDAAADAAALATLHEALVTVARLLAPAAPFTSDAIHRPLTGTSVHLAGFPEGRDRQDASLADAMQAIRVLASLARSAREAGGLRVRQPLARLRVAIPTAVDRTTFAALLSLLTEEVNVKQVDVVASDEELVRLQAKPNFAALGKVYGKQTPAAAEAARALTPQALRELEAGRPVTVPREGGAFTFRPEDVVVERQVISDWLIQSNGPYVVALDPSLSDALRGEGLAREVVNRVQRLRKEAGYDYATRIMVSVSGAPDVLAAAADHQAFIAGETLARRLETGSDLPRADVSQRVDIDGREVVISLKRYDDSSHRGAPA